MKKIEATLPELIDAKAIWDAFPGSVIGEVMVERARQDAQWGGPKHDDEHKPADWLTYIDQQVSKAHRLLRDAPDATLDTDQHDAALRERLVKVAALALAGLASYERKNPPAVCQCPGCRLEELLNRAGAGARVEVIDGDSDFGAVLAAILSGRGRPGAVH